MTTKRNTKVSKKKKHFKYSELPNFDLGGPFTGTEFDQTTGELPATMKGVGSGIIPTASPTMPKKLSKVANPNPDSTGMSTSNIMGLVGSLGTAAGSFLSNDTPYFNRNNTLPGQSSAQKDVDQVVGSVLPFYTLGTEIGNFAKGDYQKTDQYGALKNKTKFEMGDTVGMYIDPLSSFISGLEGEGWTPEGRANKTNAKAQANKWRADTAVGNQAVNRWQQSNLNYMADGGLMPTQEDKPNIKKVEEFAGISFNKAFGIARSQGRDIFSWRGKQYGTKLASEVEQKPTYKANKDLPEVDIVANRSANQIKNVAEGVKPYHHVSNPSEIGPSPDSLNIVDRQNTAPASSTKMQAVKRNGKLDPTTASEIRRPLYQYHDMPQEVKDIVEQHKKNPKWKESKQKYYVFSKEAGVVYAFDHNHKLIDTSPWMRGATAGDFPNTADAERGINYGATTPAGKGIIESEDDTPETIDEYGVPVPSFKYTSGPGMGSEGISMHAPFGGEPWRLQKIYNEEADKLYGWGCNNVQAEFLKRAHESVRDSFEITKEPERMQKFIGQNPMRSATDIYAMGGEMSGGVGQMNSGQGSTTQYNVGGTHENNPNGGIPVDKRGNPASVSGENPVAVTEEDEVTWYDPSSKESYVFSNRIFTS
jgi:hypothetical protein